MALESIQQLEKLLLDSKNVLIILPQKPDGDVICAGWAFYFFLKKKEIEAELVFSGEAENKKKFHFLPQPEKIREKISGARDFILSFNTRFNKIVGWRSEAENEEFKIYITPERGSIDPRDFSFIPAKFKFDLIIVLGSPDKEKLGKIYEENPDIFYEVPVVNVDNHSNNESFGQINIIELNASSVSEIIAGVLENINSFSVNKDVADCLLAGIISATDSFQKKNTTPKALKTAAHLIDLGADQQMIVRHLYKTQPFNILRLWGRVMARLKWDGSLGLVFAPIYLEDFVQSRTTPENIPLILSKIQENYSTGKIFLVLFSDSADKVTAVFKFSVVEEAERICKILGGEIFEDSVILKISGKNMEEAEKEIIGKLKAA
jgi:phosphoesterase RecJ-like protein